MKIGEVNLRRCVPFERLLEEDRGVHISRRAMLSRKRSEKLSRGGGGGRG